MVDAGLTPMEAIKAGTSNASRLLMMDDVGSLKPGMLADIAVTDGNPLTDISCLADAEHITFVAADGKIVKNRLDDKVLAERT